MKRYRVAVDIGGTFVDAVQLNMTSGKETSVTVVHSDQFVEVDSFGSLLVKRSAR
jgi:N-methylhydantoinase A/oxoprolinase/acetone carboxylase beta subunit